MYPDYIQRGRRQSMAFELRRAKDREARALQELNAARSQIQRAEAALAELEKGPAAESVKPSAASVFEEVSSMLGVAPEELQALLATDEGRGAVQGAAKVSGAKLKKYLAEKAKPQTKEGAEAEPEKVDAA
jgi:hypothetical protein